MPCGQRCKEILDNGDALGRAVACMKNSILLNAAEGGAAPPADLLDDFKSAAEAAATAAVAIANYLHPA